VARWLKLKLITATPFGSVSRMVSYEYMNRQLVWNAFTVGVRGPGAVVSILRGGSLIRLSPPPSFCLSGILAVRITSHSDVTITSTYTLNHLENPLFHLRFEIQT
jgi:hypothetical protein